MTRGRGGCPPGTHASGCGRWLLAALGLLLAAVAPVGAQGTESGEATTPPWSGWWWPAYAGALVLGYRGDPGPLEKLDQLNGRRASLWEKSVPTHYHLNSGPTWWGHCQAWAAASVLEPEPQNDVTRGGITFHVGDLKGLLTEAHYADRAVFYGSRYNGQPWDDFEDIYPLPMWDALRQHLKVNGTPLVFDLNPGTQVWNYPAFKYQVDWQPLGMAAYQQAAAAAGRMEQRAPLGSPPAGASAFQGQFRLWVATFDVDPDIVGTASVEHVYSFVFLAQGSQPLPGSDHWSGASIQDHPDFAWYPVQRAQDNTELDYGLVHALATAAVGPAAPTLSLTLDAATLIGSQSTQGTIVLPAPAPGAGATVTLASDDPAVSVPASVPVSAGAGTAQFPITTQYVTGPKAATAKITAGFGTLSALAGLTVQPISVTSLSLQPASVVGGNPVTGSLTLNIPAPPAGLTVLLSSTPAGVAAVPDSITVPPGQGTATFPVTTNPVSGPQPVKIGAQAGGASQQAILTVLPVIPAVQSVAFDTNPVVGGHPVTGTVSLVSPAPASGVTVTLTSSAPAVAHGPASVHLPGGSSSATFAITTTSGHAATFVNFTAATPTGGQTGSLTVIPRSSLTAFTVSPSTVVAGHPSTGTVTLSAAASGSGLLLTLTSDNPSIVAVPGSVTIPAGARSVSFPIRTMHTTYGSRVGITATGAGGSLPAVLTVWAG